MHRSCRRWRGRGHWHECQRLGCRLCRICRIHVFCACVCDWQVQYSCSLWHSRSHWRGCQRFYLVISVSSALICAGANDYVAKYSLWASLWCRSMTSMSATTTTAATAATARSNQCTRHAIYEIESLAPAPMAAAAQNAAYILNVSITHARTTHVDAAYAT